MPTVYSMSDDAAIDGDAESSTESSVVGGIQSVPPHSDWARFAPSGAPRPVAMSYPTVAG